MLTENVKCSMKFKWNELDYGLESSMNCRRTSRTLKITIPIGEME